MANLIAIILFFSMTLVLVRESPAPPILPAGPNKFQVTATAYTPTSCSIVANDVLFPVYDYTIKSEAATATALVTCTNGRGYTMYPDNGGQFSGGSRRMVNSGNYLSYGLYQDSGYSQPFGIANQISGTGNGTQQTISFYGYLPVGQAVPDGPYSDTVTMVVDYLP